MNIVQQARDFAIKAHGNQRYGKMPYEYHLQQVVDKLIHWRDLGQWEITDEMIAAAWLHDVLEDTLVRHTDLYIEFGDEITEEPMNVQLFIRDVDKIEEVFENMWVKLGLNYYELWSEQ